MSKRRIENGIDELNEEILGELPPDERVQLLLEAYGEDKAEWSRSLAETCPRHQYIQPDQQVISRMELLSLFAAQAVYELHTAYLEYQLCWQQQRHCWSEASLSEEGREQVQARTKALRELVASLYMLYHSYRRFVTETMDVEVDIWLQLHPNGPAVFEAVGDLLEDRRQVRLADDHVTELLEEIGRADEIGAEDRGEALDQLVDQRYEGLVNTWERTIAQAP